MVIVAVDVGYSNLKVLAGSTSRKPIATILPAGAGPITAMPEALSKASDDGHQVVVVDGQVWVAGVEPGRLQNWERELHPEYPGTKSYRALFHAALAATGAKRVDRLVTGLPVSQYHDKAKREALRAMLSGSHQVTARHKVFVAAVDVLPQPAGAYLDTIDDATCVDAFEHGRTLVIDPGFFSVDWVLIDGGELRGANSGSSALAMSVLIETADDLIHAEHGARPGRDAIEKAIRGEHGQVMLFGARVDVAPYLAAAASRTAPLAITAVKQSLRGEKRPPDVVILAGGGADTYAEATRAAFPRAKVIVPDRPVLANVRGFWNYAAGSVAAEGEAA